MASTLSVFSTAAPSGAAQPLPGRWSFWNCAANQGVGGDMAYTELDLAQVDRRLSAVERCVTRQREILKQHIDAGMDTDAPLQKLAEFEATLLELRRERTRIRDGIAAANVQELLDLFATMPSRQSSQLASSYGRPSR